MGVDGNVVQDGMVWDGRERWRQFTMVCWSLKVLLPDITSPNVETAPIWTAPGMRCGGKHVSVDVLMMKEKGGWFGGGLT